LKPINEALKVERWLRQNRSGLKQGIAWPAVAGDTAVVTNLYSGTSGIVLFYLELYHSTNDKSYLEEAEKGADYILAVSNGKKIGYDEVGLYTGEAGVCFMFNQVFAVTKKSKYKLAAAQSLERLRGTAKTTGDRTDWRYNDIVYGGAGIGLMLLNIKTSEALNLAKQTGNELLAKALPAEGGEKWFMDSAMVRQSYYMPNFSHGTAGVSYFLAKLYQRTGKKEYLEGAMAGAHHLTSIENKDAWVYHHDKEEGKDLYYLSWCHGPAGTARLYYLLYQITKDESWKARIIKASEAIMHCGIPTKQLPGYWNNVSMCCGSASVASFFLDLHELFGEKAYLDFSMEITKNLIGRGTRDGDGMKWVQAEHRRRPEFLQAQTGYMQGAAGIGMWFLRLDAFQKKSRLLITLPDNPF
jgi:lantibiotic modifying enzyme